MLAIEACRFTLSAESSYAEGNGAAGPTKTSKGSQYYAADGEEDAAISLGSVN